MGSPVENVKRKRKKQPLHYLPLRNLWTRRWRRLLYIYTHTLVEVYMLFVRIFQAQFFSLIYFFFLICHESTCRKIMVLICAPPRRCPSVCSSQPHNIPPTARPACPVHITHLPAGHKTLQSSTPPATCPWKFIAPDFDPR